jgi:phage-related protein (TIGR01555 family)
VTKVSTTSAGAGAGFGEGITDQDLTFAVKREPAAHRIVFAVAHDVFDNWFTVDDLATEGKDEKFNRIVQAELSKLKAKSVFTEMAVFERTYGWAVIVVGYQDSGKTLADPVKDAKSIVELAAYAPTQVGRIVNDVDPGSLRYGLPERYYVKRSGSLREKVHFSRVIHFATRLIDHPYKGLSVLEPVWDDLTNLRNIRWGMGQTMFRYGSGFPDIELQGATKKQLDDFVASGQFKDLHARTYFVHNERQKLEFKGAQGVALDPTRYYEPILESIAVGSGLPKAVIRGAQAGALTGSEVNEREYFKIISDAQSRYEPGIRYLIDKLIEIRQVKTSVTNYDVNWCPSFEINPRDKALAEYNRNRSLVLKTNWMTVNEIRAEEGLESVEGGDVVLGLQKLQAPRGVISRDFE